MIIDFLVGLMTGIISGFGVGGGSLLVLYLTNFEQVHQLSAQGINLMYFLFVAPSALYSHIKNKLIDKNSAIICIISGVPTCILFAFIASKTDIDLLRRLFGMLMLFIGVRELFAKKTHKSKEKE